MKLGFIGTGAMGYPMVKNLLDAQHDIAVYNRTRDKVFDLEQQGAELVDTPAEAARDKDLVITMVSDDDAMETVVFGGDEDMVSSGQGLIDGLPDGSIHLAMSTIGKHTAQHLTEQHQKHGQVHVAGPVFGKPDFAEAGRLSVVAAGPDKEIDQCVPVFDVVGRQYFNVGDEPWKANLVKLAGNFTLAGMMETLGEAIALMKKSNVDPHEFVEVINGSLFDSPLYENYGTLIAEGNYEPAGFKLRLGDKDIRLGLRAADEVNVPMPLAHLIHDQFLTAIANNRGDIDWAGIGEIVAKNAGLDE